MRAEKEELERIILMKERQIQALSEVDAVNSDVGALQLGRGRMF
jgi:hypothetical protein